MTTTKKEVDGLTAEQTLIGAYHTLWYKFKGKMVHFAKPIRAAISGDGSDLVGHLIYEAAIVLMIDGKKWALAFGRASHSCRMGPPNYEIAAVAVDNNEKSESEVSREIEETLKRNIGLNRSLVCATFVGNLGGFNDKNRLGKAVNDRLRNEMSEFVAKEPEVSDQISLETMEQIVESPGLYKREFTHRLAQVLEEVLRTV